MKELTPNTAHFEEWSKEEKEQYFWKASREFSNLHARRDSVVRLAQEKLISEDLDKGVPVLIRGNWRVGKTSMAQSLISHFYAGNAVFIDTGMYAGEEKKPLEDFKAIFGSGNVAEFVINQEYSGKDEISKFQKVKDLRNQLRNNGQNPFEYLNEYMVQKGKTCFVAIDEAIAYADRKPELLEYLASLKDLPNVKLAIVLHRIQEYEEMFKEIFKEFKTHWIKSLPRSETATLVQHGLSGTEIKFTNDAIDEMQQFTGGRPLETNILCDMLLSPRYSEIGCEIQEAMPVKEYKLVYNADDIRKITGQGPRMLLYLFERITRHYERIYKVSMSDEERELADRIAIGDDLPENFEEIIQGLIDTDIVVKDERTGEYRINGRLLEETILNME